MRRMPILLAALLLAAGAPSLGAQRVTSGGGMGVALPVGDAAERRTSGPAATVTFELYLSRRWSLRLDGDWSLLQGRPAPAGQEVQPAADLQAYGVALNAVARVFDAATTPYLLAGAGVYRLQAGDARNPYGPTAALQAGVGVETRVSPRIQPFAEARITVHATDYASREFAPTIYWPLLFGLRIS